MFDDGSKTSTKQWRKLVHPVSLQEHGYNIADLHLPATLDVMSRPYQLDGAAWLQQQKRALLADDAGLGKTIQATMAATRPVLVTCPTYAVLQWADVIESEYPNETIAVAGVGNRQQRHHALTGNNPTAMVGPAPADWTIVNTDMHRGYYLPDVETWIVDEMHHFRNREAERSKLANEYAQRIPRIFGLTATPVFKDVTNLWHLMNMLDPVEWSSYWRFFQEYAKTTGDAGWGANKVIGIWNPKKLERELIPYMLRRTYKDVGLFLPDQIDKDVLLEFNDAERKLYRQVKEQYVYEDIPLTSQGAVLRTLRACTVAAKINAAKDILEDNPEPTVVFTWYRDSAEDMAEAIKGIVITGDDDPDKRAYLAKGAIAANKPVVATIASLSEAVDLSACKQVIQLEEDYVPGSMYQERRRFVRWTPDERPVVIHNLRVRNTVDGDVHRAVMSRQGSAASILKDALS